MTSTTNHLSLISLLLLASFAGILLGGISSSRFARCLSANVMITAGSSLILIGGLMLTILFKLQIINIIGLYGAAIMVFFGSALLIPNASMQALAVVDDHANGASIMNATALFLSSLFVHIAAKFTAVPANFIKTVKSHA
jgi:hypothetical protein